MDRRNRLPVSGRAFGSVPKSHTRHCSHFSIASYTFADFWTTKCTRCPDALSKLDDMAQDPKYADVHFVSICCDLCDGAREIIERDEKLRWSHVSHYFMEQEDKEIAKEILGFKTVPFYVVLNEFGEIVQKGGTKQIDFNSIPGMKSHLRKVQKVEEPSASSPASVNRVFIMDEDF
jgi:thiol-disulfide isomerase/thioredoxin